MADDQPPKLRLLQFHPEPSADWVRVGPPSDSARYGIFPLQEDVIVTLDVFNVFLWELERGTPESRKSLAAMLRSTYGALFQPKPKAGG